MRLLNLSITAWVVRKTISAFFTSGFSHGECQSTWSLRVCACVGLFPQAAAGPGGAGFEAVAFDRDLLATFAAAQPSGIMLSDRRDVILCGPKDGEAAEGLACEVFACNHRDLLLFFFF